LTVVQWVVSKVVKTVVPMVALMAGSMGDARVAEWAAAKAGEKAVRWVPQMAAPTVALMAATRVVEWVGQWG
jgi:hypothetical protein